MGSSPALTLDYSEPKRRKRFSFRPKVMLFVVVVGTGCGAYYYRAFIAWEIREWLFYQQGYLTAKNDIETGRLSAHELRGLWNENVNNRCFDARLFWEDDPSKTKDTFNRGYQEKIRSAFPDLQPEDQYLIARMYALGKRYGEWEWSSHQVPRELVGLPDIRDLSYGSGVGRCGSRELDCEAPLVCGRRKVLQAKCGDKPLSDALDFIYVGLQSYDLKNNKNGLNWKFPSGKNPYEISDPPPNSAPIELSQEVLLSVESAGELGFVIYGKAGQRPRRILVDKIKKPPLVLRIYPLQQFVIWQLADPPKRGHHFIGWHWPTGLRLAAWEQPTAASMSSTPHIDSLIEFLSKSMQ